MILIDLFSIVLCPISKIVTPPPFNVENIAELVNEPGNFNTERKGSGAKKFMGFIGHDIMTMIVVALKVIFSF